ncbi:adenylate kinase family protein [Actinomadura macrotermitis]|uniref:Adenylate kinase n=1 Tax=Actinomadura macrotermitis TaxID=2585200 RepID=A0A7K0C0R6_9ACTN|nr:adenylate kinase [Actinomadura macrotermitis]
MERPARSRIFLMGSPATGEEAPGPSIASRLSLPKVSLRDTLRVNVHGDTEFGRQAKACMDRGVFFPDELIIAMMHERLSQDGARDGFLLDGFPWTVPQAQALKEFLAAEFDAGLDLVLQPVVDHEEIVRRLSGRRICDKCGCVWHVGFDDIQDGACGNCGGDLIQRDDDREEVVRQRLQAHQERSAALVRFYAEDGIVLGFDAMGPVEEVTERALHAIHAGQLPDTSSANA